MKKYLLTTLLLLTGCNDWQVDQDKRILLFNSCIQQLPAGPEKTAYNDWDEVVETCDNIARSQALYDANKEKK